MSAKQETNMEKLNRHRADLARCYATREKLNERIARLEERVNQEENQEYLQIVHSTNISLDDLRLMMQGRTLHAVPTKMKEAIDNEEEQEQTNAEDDEEFSILARGVIEKVSSMTDQAFREMSHDLIPDFDKDE